LAKSRKQKNLKMRKRVVLKIFGKVQGVFFRQSAKEKADELGVVGFAKNEKDGSVFMEAEGEKKKLDLFIKWCQKGPSRAQVEKVEKKFLDKLKKEKTFLIYY